MYSSSLENLKSPAADTEMHEMSAANDLRYLPPKHPHDPGACGDVRLSSSHPWKFGFVRGEARVNHTSCLASPTASKALQEENPSG